MMKKKKSNVNNIIRQIKEDHHILMELNLHELKWVTEKLNLKTEVLDKRKKSKYIEILDEYFESLQDDNDSIVSEAEDLFDEEVADEDEYIRPLRTWADLALKIAYKAIHFGFAVLELVILGKNPSGGKKK